MIGLLVPWRMPPMPASLGERHVVAQDLKFFPVLRDCGERVVRRRRLDRII
jgi:hypothetical protein